jgi:ABC-type Fe3+ transport system permease subunit
LPAFCEVTLSVLLRGPRTEVLGTRLFSLQSYGAPQQAAVLALLVTLVVAGGLLLTRPRQL